MAFADTDQEPQWKDYLDVSHHDVPLHALNYSCQRRIALYLSMEQDVMHNNLVPDFGGLAELIGFDGLEIENFERSENPGKRVLDEWKRRDDLNPTVGRLIEFLAFLGRIDVLTDCHESIRADVVAFLDRPNQFAKKGPIQDETVTPGPGYDELPQFITGPDVIARRQVLFDAFLCYNPKGEASKDIEFVMELVEKFEAPPHNLKLFVPYRDDLPGFNEHKINAKIISERCRHMIVVLSNNFHESQACDFQTSFAFSLSPGARNKRIVPVKIDDCPIPNVLRIMACCDFTKKDLRDWSWDRLLRSIQIQLSTEDYQLENSPTLDLSSSFLPPGTQTTSSWSSSPSGEAASVGREKRSPSDADLGYNSLSSSSNVSPVSGRRNVTAPVFSDARKPGQSSNPEPMEVDSSSKPHQYNYTASVVRGKQKSPSSPSLGSRALKKLADMTSKRSKPKGKTNVASTDC